MIADLLQLATFGHNMELLSGIHHRGQTQHHAPPLASSSASSSSSSSSTSSTSSSSSHHHHHHHHHRSSIISSSLDASRTTSPAASPTSGHHHRHHPASGQQSRARAPANSLSAKSQRSLLTGAHPSLCLGTNSVKGHSVKSARAGQHHSAQLNLIPSESAPGPLDLSLRGGAVGAHLSLAQSAGRHVSSGSLLGRATHRPIKKLKQQQQFAALDLVASASIRSLELIESSARLISNRLASVTVQTGGQSAKQDALDSNGNANFITCNTSNGNTGGRSSSHGSHSGSSSINGAGCRSGSSSSSISPTSASSISPTSSYHSAHSPAFGAQAAAALIENLAQQPAASSQARQLLAGSRGAGSKAAANGGHLLISAKSGRRQKQKGTKSHLCNHCGRSFSRSDMLTRHSRLHSGLKPYQCGKCFQVFSRSDHLSTHERTHTGEKPYQCEICAYSACRRDMITRHMRTHSSQLVKVPSSSLGPASGSGPSSHLTSGVRSGATSRTSSGSKTSASNKQRTKRERLASDERAIDCDVDDDHDGREENSDFNYN